ncbi:MAG: cell division protein FtsZ [Bacteroidetes bacterium]|nr:cell division protein FtsZ [Bacteroidota bacterium]MDA1121091.1 cell division protein FtsZ [Bacteroidota bacterium]
MTEKPYQFDIPTHRKSIIKVIGVGGGGSNAVNHMFNQGIKDVEFVVCNTDLQALESSPIPKRLQIGIHLTEGLGAGANPEMGRNAAIESKEDIRELLSENTKMVFITAGMGGGTGTGAAPIIAQVARELDILTVGIVTAPFSFEGKKKMIAADKGIDELKEFCDTVLVISNDKLREVHGNLSIRDAFGQADNVLTTAAKGIAEIITVPGHVNVDFEDVRTVMRNSGAAVMGSATVSGENRATRAAEMAISSPLLNNKNIHGAQKILLSIISGEEAELQMDELAEITDYMQESAGDNAEVIFGHGIDSALGDSIRVTIIATGFEAREEPYYEERRESKKVFDLESTKQIDLFNEGKVTSSEGIVDEETESNGYFFESPEKEDEVEEDEKILFEIGEDCELVNKHDLGEDDELEELSGSAIPQSRKWILIQKAEERRSRLKELKNPDDIDAASFKEKLEIPAYQRKNVHLQDVPHSSENNLSRYTLNDDNKILGNNRFLHDNVD